MEKAEKDKCIYLLLASGFSRNSFGGYSRTGREIVFIHDNRMASYPSDNSSGHVIIEGFEELALHLGVSILKLDF